MIKYSFVIPTYNKKRLLKNTLKYIDAQKGIGNYDYEVIVIDDGSDDNTFDFIKGINKNYELKYVYLERSKNSCRSIARNIGLKNANGEIVIFIDDDILINHDYLKELDRYYSFEENFVVIGTRINLPYQYIDIVINDWKAIIKDAYKSINSRLLEFRHPILNSLSYNLSAHRFPWAIVYSCNFAIPKRIIQNIGGFDEDFKEWGYEDIELGCRISKTEAKIVINSKLEVMHQFHEKSKEGKNNFELFKDKCIKENQALFEKNRDDFIPIIGMFRTGFIADEYKNTRHKMMKQEIINFENKNEIDNIKNRILSSFDQRGHEIVVNDYIEDTDLDIWIQLQKPKDSIILYYPMSKLVRISSISIIDRIISGIDV